MPETQTETAASSLAGRTLRWTFEDGPMAGATYEHTFEEGGGVTFHKVDGAAGARPTREKRHAAFEIAPGVHVASYLAESGFTLTVAMSFETERLVGFASNETEWHPVSGRLEVVK